MRTLLFTVGRLEFVGSRKFMIAGRNCRDELRRGDRLCVHNPADKGSEVVFCVEEITLYNRTVEAVDHGHTAGLFFPIELANKVCLGDELCGFSEP
ncbi:hypothetical protein GCM10023213_02580 [Prosthecobacter algae]|uniref:Uncharacterized protein n=1 Tax=Prosthecobacter algae TaxID=1144682 RepID=A0ABP9NTF9_9BACT